MGFNILICDDFVLVRKIVCRNLLLELVVNIFEVLNGMDVFEVLVY